LVEAGLFVGLGGLGFVFLLLSFKFGALLKALSAVIFFSLAMILFAGYEIAYTSELTGGLTECTDSVPCLERNFVVREDDITGETFGSWMAWVMIMLGILSSMLFILEMFVWN